ncbi:MULTISPECIES: hypothetical protein [Sphingobacterium]|uniref:hypothetical protein n=1 Tax=Sphingobacterium TaxID=28453 RepID=UPI00129C9853|nr:MULTISPECIES: hypothetical protein [Sphingobacterium]
MESGQQLYSICSISVACPKQVRTWSEAEVNLGPYPPGSNRYSTFGLGILETVFLGKLEYSKTEKVYV